MTQSQFNTLFTSGDRNAAWAAVENHISQKVSAAHAEKDMELVEKDKALTVLTDAILAVKSAPDHKTAVALATEAAKSDLEKRRAAIDSQIDSLKSQRDKL